MDGWFSLDTSGFDAELISLLTSQGYTTSTGQNIIFSANGIETAAPDGAMYVFPSETVSGSVSVTTTVPTTTLPTEPVAPPPPITYYQLVRKLNSGWNTSARSVDPLVAGSYLVFAVAEESMAACVGIGPKGMDGAGIHLFSHALTIDKSGVTVYENGIIRATLRNLPSALTALRICRHTDGTIAYVATTATETLVHTSTVPCPLPSFIPAYAYGRLYNSGDKITSAAFATGEVQYGSA